MQGGAGQDGANPPEETPYTRDRFHRNPRVGASAPQPPQGCLPFNLDLVLPSRLMFEEEDAPPAVQDDVAAGLQPDRQGGAAGGQVVEEPLGGQQFHPVPLAEGDGREKEKKPRRKRKIPTEEEQRMASMRRSGLRSAKKVKREEGGREEEKEGED